MRLFATTLPALCLAAAAATAALPAGCSTASSGRISDEWKARGFNVMEEGPLQRLAGNYLVRKRVYTTSRGLRLPEEGDKPAQRVGVMRLFYAAPGKAPAEVPFPDGYSVDPDVSGLYVSPDGDRMMCPGTSVDAKPLPSLLTVVTAGKPGRTYEPQRLGRKMTFVPHPPAPLWSADGKRFALEAAEIDSEGLAYHNVFLWRWLPNRAEPVMGSVERAVNSTSVHFAGWGPGGQGGRLAVIEGFPRERYQTGPDRMVHQVFDGGFERPVAKPVRLWLLDTDAGTATAVATRVNSWLKGGRPSPDPFHFGWNRDGTVAVDPLAKKLGGS